MTIHEKIRFMRQQKLWSQEQMANYLGMSINGYGSIERGDTDIGLSRLEQIASLFGVGLHQLFALNEEHNGFHFFGANSTGNNTGIQTNNIYCNYRSESNASDCNHLRKELELEKQLFINEQKEKELTYLREINDAKERELIYLKEINALKERKIFYLKEINRLVKNKEVETMEID